MSFSETSDLSSVEHLWLQRHHIEAAEAAESALLPGRGLWDACFVLWSGSWKAI